MAELTDTERQQLLILEVGEVAGNLLATNIGLLWSKYASFAPVSADLRDRYVKVGLIDIALGAARQAVTFTDGDYGQSASHVAQRLLEMRKAATDELAILADEASSSSGVTSGQLTTVTPQTPPQAPLVRPFGPDATDPEYQGSPYWPLRRVPRW